MKEKNELVAIYIRTSTTEQNPHNQLKDCESINKWGSYILLEDQVTGWKEAERKGFNELKNLVMKRKIKHLIVWDLDRIYRNRKNLIAFLQLLKVYKIKLHSYRQVWLEEINKVPEPWNEIIYDMLINIFGWLAEEESNKKSERVNAAKIKEKGKKTYSKYGNKWGRKDLSTYKKNRIKEYFNAGYSTRAAAQELGVSKSAVHKYYIILKREKP